MHIVLIESLDIFLFGFYTAIISGAEKDIKLFPQMNYPPRSGQGIMMDYKFHFSLQAVGY